ncbi:hypothetical protein BCR33DRAFT_786518 [Rhizoclosmatium globosum]|uniref:Uncharacterized protein n=1 Tax=Rhizoclosmatium globosum TaxID=329046 RepID=A0A1Y2C5K6_9FUNG|nr:hypothetical protein BCR33DRAFT_786518 [Rhizoclosmatium globosum]|eukprot:ORY42311.1 hypothetical protein BCR33DRAFT_786518 [Rhizoclosmatium globosum]
MKPETEWDAFVSILTPSQRLRLAEVALSLPPQSDDLPVMDSATVLEQQEPKQPLTMALNNQNTVPFLSDKELETEWTSSDLMGFDEPSFTSPEFQQQSHQLFETNVNISSTNGSIMDVVAQPFVSSASLLDCVGSIGYIPEMRSKSEPPMNYTIYGESIAESFSWHIIPLNLRLYIKTLT